jgi:phospholipid/cholesterol/gamma-HCH transport system ATP-binding protein
MKRSSFVMDRARSHPVAAIDPVEDHPLEIRIEDLHKVFDDNAVLRGVDLDVRRGEIAAIVGGSGCGKTVLLEHIIGQMQPDSGRVLVADHEETGSPLVDLAAIDDIRMDRIRVHWAVVFQRNALFTGTVYENLALWLREVKGLPEAEIRPLARAALVAVGLDADEVIDQDRDDLSGGMAKRVAVARALAMEPILMFYDEPTTGLDPQHAAQIHDLIATTHQHENPGGARTTLIITHDKDLLHRLHPRIIMIHEGRIYYDGTYEHFRELDSPIIRPYFDLMPVLQLRPLTG